MPPRFFGGATCQKWTGWAPCPEQYRATVGRGHKHPLRIDLLAIHFLVGYLYNFFLYIGTSRVVSYEMLLYLLDDPQMTFGQYASTSLEESCASGCSRICK